MNYSKASSGLWNE